MAEPVTSLKGFDATTTIQKLQRLAKILPPTTEYGVAADFNGFSVTYKLINDAIRRLQDTHHGYIKKDSNVRFYCWSITFSGTYKSAEALRTKILNAGLLFHEDQAKYGKYNLDKIASYFEKNMEDVNGIKSFTLGLSTDLIRDQEEEETIEPAANVSQASQQNQMEITKQLNQTPTTTARTPNITAAGTAGLSNENLIVLNYHEFINEDSFSHNPIINEVIESLAKLVSTHSSDNKIWTKLKLASFIKRSTDVKSLVTLLEQKQIQHIYRVLGSENLL